MCLRYFLRSGCRIYSDQGEGLGCLSSSSLKDHGCHQCIFWGLLSHPSCPDPRATSPEANRISCHPLASPHLQKACEMSQHKPSRQEERLRSRRRDQGGPYEKLHLTWRTLGAHGLRSPLCRQAMDVSPWANPAPHWAWLSFV